MADQLSTEQVLLLENLMYLTNDEPFQTVTDSKNMTVKQMISHIDTSKINSSKDYGSYMTGKDWKNIITAVKKDPELLNMKIVDTHVDNGTNGGGGASAVFVNPKTNEAVVAFRGTASHEWKDNFTGGGPTDASDHVSTLQQQNALEWYRSLNKDQYSSVTVTGHSKGGNKAKYITVMDDSVDRCLSFDGQGFSDEFINKYRDQIAKNQNKILNNNVENDYVNLLLNDIGNTKFYKGYDYGDGKFLENHCPNTFFNFDKSGNFTMTPGKRSQDMSNLDKFLNSYLRTLSPEDKKATLLMIGKLAEAGFCGEDANSMLGILLEDNNVDHAANLAAYLLAYKKEHPELLDTLNRVLKNMELDDVAKIVNTISDITDWKFFNTLLSIAGWASGHIPDFIYDKLREYLESKGIHLTNEELKKLLSMLQTMSDDMEDMDVNGNGDDLVVKSKNAASAGSSDFKHFNVFPGNLNTVVSEFNKDYISLMAFSQNVLQISNCLRDEFSDLKKQLVTLSGTIKQESKSCASMGKALEQIQRLYTTHEQKIISNASGH